MSSELQVGKTIWLKLPYGELFQKPHSKEHCVFIAGGTGITPYLSLFTDASFRAYSSPTLYFGYRSDDYNIYSQQLQKAMQNNSSLLVKCTVEENEGFLKIENILDENHAAQTFFISGPPQMIRLFKKHLLLHVDVSKVMTDEWE
jgi:ferredoxin-NADP reductase